MNSIEAIANRTPSVATVAIVGMSAAMMVGAAKWPTYEKQVYSVNRAAPSYSVFLAEGVRINANEDNQKFASAVSEFYKLLIKNQEPLGEEFEAIYFANVEDLYEA